MGIGVTKSHAVSERRRVGSFLVVFFIGAAMLPGAEPAHAAEIECGKRVRRSITLTADLLNCPAAGLVIRANGVTVDLNGNTLSGTGAVGQAYFGIDNTRGHSNVTIKNGTILNFTTGIVSEGGSNIRVKQIAANDNEVTGIYIERGRSHLVAQSTATGNGNGGIAVLDANFSIVRLSTGTNNGNDGIQVIGRENLITGSTASDGAANGIGVLGNRNTIETNETSDNGKAGIVAIGNNNVVRDHTAERNKDGIAVVGDNNRVRLSTASSNTRDGVVIKGTANLASETTASDNGENGFIVQTGSSNNTISTNVAEDNGLAVVDGNGLGVDMRNDASPRGFGTDATGNDNGAQCLPEQPAPKPQLCNV